MLLPFNFEKWIAENKHKLQPPVNNYCLWNENNFTVMALGGPNLRTDYHVNPTEEYFYQYKGDMLLKIVHEGEFKDLPIKEGEMFLLPGLMFLMQPTFPTTLVDSKTLLVLLLK